MKMLPAIPRALCSEAMEGIPVTLPPVARLIDFELRSKRAPHHAGKLLPHLPTQEF